MKKEYMKPAMRVVELKHKTMLLQSSSAKSLGLSGFDDGDELNVSDEGGGSSILDR